MYSLCLTNYNRYYRLIESFKRVIDDPRITEIIISDDASDIDLQKDLMSHFWEHPKVSLHFNMVNIGMAANKKRAVELANNDWVLLWDSDNIFDVSYIDALSDWCTPESDPKTIYCPEFAKPQFNFISFAGSIYDVNNIAALLKYPMGQVQINTANYVVNKDWYLNCFQSDPDVKGADTVFHAYNHLKAGGNFIIVPGMQYIHVRSDDSEFAKDMDYNLKHADWMVAQIKKLKQ